MYDVCVRFMCTMYVYDVRDMMYVYEVRVNCMCMMYLHDVRVQCTNTMYVYDVCARGCLGNAPTPFSPFPTLAVQPKHPYHQFTPTFNDKELLNFLSGSHLSIYYLLTFFFLLFTFGFSMYRVIFSTGSAPKSEDGKIPSQKVKVDLFKSKM